MLAFLSWYLVTSILGLLTFPLAYRLFPALADRGYSLSRALGLLIWGYIFWLLASLGIAPNNLAGLLFALLILASLSAWSFWKTTRDHSNTDDQSSLHAPRSSLLTNHSSLIIWLKSHLRLILTTELLFLLSFAFLAVIRAANPEIVGTEKPMELAFINAILRSPSFPPSDPWLSGYAISYYYFGYVLTAMLARLTGVLGSVAFNLMLSLLFALSAVGAYGILYNLLSAWQRKTADRPLTTGDFQSEIVNRKSEIVNRKSSIGLPLLAPLFLLLVSNLEGFLEVLHKHGIFWPSNPQLATHNFWTWLDLKDLNLPPVQPFSWIPDRYLWWWRASRVIQDFDLAHVWHEIIDEFPFFSYLLGDLHPHVLAMPFGLLAVAAALNLFLGGWRGETNLFGYRLSISRSGFLLSALILGGLAFLNTWDILAYTALVLGAYVLFRVQERGWSWQRLEDLVALGLPLGALAILLYLPFYTSFSSQAGGILPNLIFPTRGAQLWVMFGALFLPIFCLLFYLWRGEKQSAGWLWGIGLALGLTLLLWLFSWAMGWLANLRLPDFAASFLQSQGATTVRDFFITATRQRLAYFGGLLTLLFLIASSIAFLVKITPLSSSADQSTPLAPPSSLDAPRSTLHAPPSTLHAPRSSPIVNRKSPIVNRRSSIINRKSSIENPSSFVLLLILLASLLVLAPEFVYLRDQFGWRMNTIFKFYYEAWALWSLAAAFGAALLLTELRRLWNWVYTLGLTLLLFAALTYPPLSLLTKTNGFHPSFGWTLDGAAHLDRDYPADAEAIRWLQSAPYGIIVEATIVDASYSDYAHISTYSGLPTVLGWPMHESQWRGSYTDQGSRLDDIRRLYETSDWNTAQAFLSQYQVRYVYVGTLERAAYRVNETKFQRFLQPAYQNGGVTVYEVP
jgi:YYY domain-containing protein